MPWNETGLRTMHEEAKKLAARLSVIDKEELVLVCCQLACAANGYKYVEVGLWDASDVLHYNTTRILDDCEKRVMALGELLRCRALATYDHKDTSPIRSNPT